MDKMKCIVLGSKPGANLFTADFYYSANVSLSFHESHLRTIKEEKIKNIVSASEIVSSRRNDIDKQNWHREKLKRFKMLKGDFVILNAEYFPEYIENIPVALKHTTYSTIKINSLIKSITGFRVPIVRLSSLDVKMVVHLLKDLSLQLVNQGYLVLPLFRPSTGIIALIKAINDHGTNAEYHLVGIGAQQRGVYPSGMKNTWTPKNKIDRNHVIADMAILRRLSSEYQIIIHDSTLRSLIYGV